MHVVLAGVQTPNCIRGTAWDAMSMDYRVTVLADATAAATAEVQAANLRDMQAVQIRTPTVADWAECGDGTGG
jgi:nicotinamidase-related amidase